MEFDEAVRLVREAKLTALLYTTPSHRPGKPRWRAAFPFYGRMNPGGHKKMVDRAQALFEGVLSGKSWALSQSYYFGRVEDDGYEHFRIEVVDHSATNGFIEIRQEMPEQPKQKTKGDASHTIDALPAKLQKAILKGDATPYGGDRSRLVLYVACSLVRQGWPDEAIRAILLNRNYGCSAHVLDQSKLEQCAENQVRKAREKVATDWQRDEKGRITTTSQANIEKALAALNLRLGHNTFEDQYYLYHSDEIRKLDDPTVIDLWLRIDRELVFLPNKDLFYNVLGSIARRSKFHPVANYLDRAEANWRERGTLGGNRCLAQQVWRRRGYTLHPRGGQACTHSRGPTHPATGL